MFWGIIGEFYFIIVYDYFCGFYDDYKIRHVKMLTTALFLFVFIYVFIRMFLLII
jgi:hypothetical protein